MGRSAGLLVSCWYWAALAWAHPRADLDPEFVGEPTNVTVSVGSSAVLTCAVENLGFYKVAWIRVESQTILSIQNHVITHNERITVDRKDWSQNWNLIIAKVEESDRGQYMCQINTTPMKKRMTYLEVLVPPKFVEEDQIEVMAREGTNITLSCKVKGWPLPTITWEREGGKELSGVHRAHGEDLNIIKVSRLHMGMYLCTATSSYHRAPMYQPITKNVMLHVLFPPMIWIQHQLIYASEGDTVALDCYTEAFPMSINYWTRAESCNILQPNQKFAVTISDNVYAISMRLMVSNVQKEDFGSYKCIAKNSLGTTEGVIKLYEAKPPKKLPAQDVERNSIDHRGTSYRKTYEEVRIQDSSYELMRNTNTKESRLPMSAHLERQRITNFITSIATSGVRSARSMATACQVLLSAVGVCHLVVTVMALR